MSEPLLDPKRPLQSMRLARGLLNHKEYKLSDELRERMVEAGAELMDSPDPRAKASGLRTLAQIDALNVKREALLQADLHHQEGSKVIHKGVIGHVHVTIRDAIDAVRSQFPEPAEFERIARARLADSYAGLLRDARGAGTLAACETPADAG